MFFTLGERIELSEDLDPLTTMHEASHAWFNDSLFAERWIYEGLAEEYSWRVQTAVGGNAGFGPLEPDDDDPGSIALDGWTFPEVIRDEETDDRERYGYEASFWVIHAIVEAAGVERMHDRLRLGGGQPNRLRRRAGTGDGRRRRRLAPLPRSRPADRPAGLGGGRGGDQGARPRRRPVRADRPAPRSTRTATASWSTAGAGWLPPWLRPAPDGRPGRSTRP